MAKRKKLNTRLILILSVILVFLIGAGGYGAYKMGWYRKIFRINPVEAAHRSKTAQQAGDYDEAEKQMLRAIRYAPNPAAKADYYYQFALLHLDWLNNRRLQLGDSQRAQLFNQVRAALHAAIVQDSTNLPAQRMLTELTWGIAQHGDWMLFIKEADALLTLEPNDHKTTFWRALAWASLAKGVPGANTDNAIRDFRRAIELASDNATYREAYTAFLQEEERTDEAVAAYEDAIAKIPNDARLRVYYADFLESQKRPMEAMAQIQEAIARDPKNPVGEIALADRLRRDGKMDAALSALEKAKQIDNSDSRIYSLLSYLYRIQNQPEKAVAALRDGLAIVDKKLANTPATSPADTQVRAPLLMSRSQLLALLANMLLDDASSAEEAAKAKDIAEAKDILDQLSHNESNLPGQREKIAGRLAFMEKDIAKAQPLLEQAYENLGADPQVAIALVQIYFMKDLPGKAEQVLSVMQRNPAYATDKRILLARAQLEARYRNFDEAQRYLDQVLRADPNNAEAKSLRASLGALQGETSLESVLAAKEVPPRVLAALVARAQAMWVKDERTEAISLLERLHAKVPDSDVVRQSLLTCYVGMEDLAKVKALLAEIKAAHPEQSASLDLQEKFISEKDRAKRYQLALQLADLNNTDPVKRDLDKAIYASRYGDPEGQGKYLQDAFRLKADDPVVVDRLMSYALIKQDWKLAGDCVQAAKKANLDQADGKISSARLAMAKGEFAGAIESLTQVVAKNPDAKVAWIMLGDCYLQTGDMDKAEKAFMTMAKADPSYLPALVAMAMITERQNRMAEHAGWIERAYRLDPTNPYVQQRYLVMLESKANVDEVIAYRERLLRQNPSDGDNRIRLAMLYEKAKQWPKAEGVYTALYADSTNKLAAGRLLAGFYIRTGRNKEAEKLLTDLLQSWPDKVAAYLVYADYLIDTAPDQAKAAIDKAIEIAPKDPRGPKAMSALLARRGDWAGAAEALAKYLELQPDDAAAAKEIVRYQLNADQLPQAEQRLNALMAANPSDADLLTLKGLLAARQGNREQALDDFDRAIRINPSEVMALLGEANIYLSQGKTTEAKMALTKAKGVSNDPQIAMNLADLHIRLGDLDMATMVLREILSQPETADYAPAMQKMLEIYEQQQRWPKVAEILTEAKTKFPNDPTYLLAEARMYHATGNLPRAVTAMEAALKMAPQSESLLKMYLQVLMESGDFNRVLAVTDSYKDKPNYTAVEMALRAAAMTKLNRTEEADSVFRAAFKASSSADVIEVAAQFQQAVGVNAAISKVTGWLKTGGDNTLLYLLLGMLYDNAKDYPKAAEALTKASSIAANPADKAVAERELGMTYYQMQKFTEAENSYLASLKDNGNDSATLNNLAYMYVSDMDQPAKAKPYAAQAAKIVPDSAEVLDTYGWVLAKTGDYVSAEKELLRAFQLSRVPVSSALIQYHLGWVCEQTRRAGEAVQHYRQSLEILHNPDDPLAKDISKALERVQPK
ncbi:MAG: tetratricopeptide repeat protein [Phycisphaerae bacterium]|jgi:tetratricopeptide (TPR) repeat protein